MVYSNISVIIPLYNREATIGNTLASIAAQTMLPGEVIVVDNNSIDSGMEIAKKFAEANPHISMKFANCLAQGASAARNAGAEIAEGNWLMFFDSDDIMYPGYVATISKAIHDFPDKEIFIVPQHFKFLSGKIREINPKLHGDYVASQIMHTLLTTNNMALSRRLFVDVGRWNEQLPSWNDWEFGVRLLLRYSDKAIALRQLSPQLCHLLQVDSITGIGFSHHASACSKAITEARSLIAGDTNLTPRRRTMLCDLAAYKLLMLAANCRREHNTLWHEYYHEALALVSSRALRVAYRGLFMYMYTGLPGGSHIAKILAS